MGTGNTQTIFRLNEGVNRFLITDVNNAAAATTSSTTLIASWDQAGVTAAGFNHVPGGSNILYMDGHVSFANFPDLTGQVGVLDTQFLWITGMLQASIGDCGHARPIFPGPHHEVDSGVGVGSRHSV